MPPPGRDRAERWRRPTPYRRSPLLYLILEDFRGDPVPVYRRFRERGRLAPAGLRYVASWVTTDLRRCYQVMDCDDRAVLEAWMEAWSDLVDFEVIEVLASSEAAAAIAPPPGGARDGRGAPGPTPGSDGPGRVGAAAAPEGVPLPHAGASQRVRKLEPGDAALAQRVVRALLGRSVSEASMRARLADPTNALWVVQGPAGEPVGFVWAHWLARLGRDAPQLFVYEIEVVPERRREGIGTELLGAALREAASRRADVFLLTNRSNGGAVAFYESQGGRVENGDDVLFAFPAGRPDSSA